MESHVYRLTAVFFAQLEGYAAAMAADEGQAYAWLERYRAFAVDAIESRSGSVLELTGDSVFARFPSGLDAVQASLALHRALAKASAERDDPAQAAWRCRVGVHLGDIIEKDGRIIGDDVNITARLQAKARFGGTCVSRLVYEQIRRKPGICVTPLGAHSLKNIRQRMQLYHVEACEAEQRRVASRRARRLFWHTGARRWAGVAAAAVIAVSAYLWLSPEPYEQGHYLTVESFRNLSPEHIGDYLGEGVAEAIAAQLSAIPGLYIVPADRDVGAPLRLRGSIQSTGSLLRIAYQLVSRNGEILDTGGSVDGQLGQIFRLQDQAATAIARKLADKMGIQAATPPPLALTRDVGAYDYYMQARSYLRRPVTEANLDHAIALFRSSLKEDEQFALAYSGLCEAYKQKYNLSRSGIFIANAKDFCDEAMKLAQSSTAARVANVALLIDTGDLDRAQEILGDRADEGLWLSSEWRLQGRIHWLRGADELARKAYQTAIGIEPGYYRNYVALAGFLLAQAEFEQAIKLYDQALALTPDNPYVFNNIGVANFLRGDFNSAADAYEMSSALLPTAPGISNAAIMHYYAGRYSKAVFLFEQALESAPDDYRLWVNLADAYRQTPGQAQRAAELCEEADLIFMKSLRINPNDVDLLRSRAICLNTVGKVGEAFAVMENVLELDGSDPRNLYRLAVLHVLNGQSEEGVARLEEALNGGYSPRLVRADPDLSGIMSQPELARLITIAEDKAGSGE